MRIRLLLKRIVPALGAMFYLSGSAVACDIEFTVRLKTLGENVGVELREGIVGASTMVTSKRSSSGTVVFNGLCAGSYFLAIGDGDSVSVTEPNFFREGYSYRSEIVMQSGAGNVKTLGRGAL